METAVLKSASQATLPGKTSEQIEHQSIPDMMSALDIEDDGTGIFVGATSAFSIASPRSLQWFTEITGNNECAKLMSRGPSPAESEKISKPEAFSHLEESQRTPLPSKRRAAAMLDSFFSGLGGIYPLFDDAEVRDKFARNYPVDHTQDVAWYSVLNLVFAATELLIGKIGTPDGGARKPTSFTQIKPHLVALQEASWWKWFRNAASKFLELQFARASLLSVQAMTFLAIISQILPSPDFSATVATSALRHALSIGLHRTLPHLGLTKAQHQLRKNVFWIAMTTERQMSLRLGRPSFIQDDDIGVGLPEVINDSEPHLHLRRMAQLGLIQGKIYDSLYSAKSFTKSRVERLRLAGALDDELLFWRDQLPPDTRPEMDFQPPPGDARLQIIILHLVFYDILTMIHRVSNPIGAWNFKSEAQSEDELPEIGINPRVFSGGAICVAAARNAISLTETCAAAGSISDINMIRVISYYPLSASLILFAHVLQQPRNPQALKDLEMMKAIISILASYFNVNDCFESNFVVKKFAEINKFAEEFVHKSRSQGQQAGIHVNSDLDDTTTTNARAKPRGDLAPILNTPKVESQNAVTQAPAPIAGRPRHFDNETFPQPVQEHQLSDYLSNKQPPPNGQNAFFNDTPSPMDLDPNWTIDDNLFMQPDLLMPDGGWFFPLSNMMDASWDSFDQFRLFPPTVDRHRT
ncbi:hypothetical protein IFR05_014078 [Cadophora sp. M221]|nr:hypothetical protein IFR05_014078 [Cadophora sp. M221]